MLSLAGDDIGDRLGNGSKSGGVGGVEDLCCAAMC